MNKTATKASNTAKHSGLGVASFILSLIAAATTVIFFIITMVKVFAAEGLSYNGMVVTGLLVIAAILSSFTGLIFGIIGVCQKNRKKIFSILGLVINGVIFALIIFLFLLRHFTMGQ